MYRTSNAGSTLPSFASSNVHGVPTRILARIWTSQLGFGHLGSDFDIWARILASWLGFEHPGQGLPLRVLHLARCQHDVAEQWHG